MTEVGKTNARAMESFLIRESVSQRRRRGHGGTRHTLHSSVDIIQIAVTEVGTRVMESATPLEVSFGDQT